MTRIILAALLLTASGAAANQHWSDLDGDGLLEPNEFNIDDADFGDVDINNDNIISVDEYDAYFGVRAGDNVAIPEAILPGEEGLTDDTATDVSPEIISVDE